MNNGKTWAIIDGVVAVVISVASIFQLVSSSKASKYNEEQTFLELEKRYKLEKKEEE